MTYEEYLNNKRFSPNTKDAYMNDKKHFEGFLEDRKINETEKSDIVKYMIYLQNEDYSESSISRKVAALKNYFYYALNMRLIDRDPTFDIETPKVKKIDRKDPLSMDIINKFINLPLNSNTLKGKRDTLMFKLIFLTGINTIDILEKKIDSINLDIGYFLYRDEYIALEEELLDLSRDYIERLKIKYPKNTYLLVNMYGNQLTRQGVWKIFKSYSKKMDIDEDITAQTLINNHLYYN